ncbi:glutamate-cysteine ligase [Streptococcus suis]|nr:glutamate-cysteine ligase [Streptococcus suis]
MAAFEQQQKESESKDVQTPESKVKQSQPKKVNITSDYKQHLADTIAQNNKDISACQKQIEELHQLIDEKKIQNKKLQAISVAIDDL